MHVPQSGPGFGAEFLDEHLAGALIGGERFGLPSVAVEGEHELGVQTFPERITGDQAPQLGDHVRVTPQVQVGVDACFQCLQPHLGQTRDLPVRQQLRTDIGQRIAPPQRDGRARLVGRVPPPSLPRGRPRGA